MKPPKETRGNASKETTTICIRVGTADLEALKEAALVQSFAHRQYISYSQMIRDLISAYLKRERK